MAIALDTPGCFCYHQPMKKYTYTPTKKYVLVSKIPDLLRAMGIEYPVAYLMLAGISRPTAQKIAAGGIYLYPDTLEKIAARLGVTSIAELFEFEITE